MYSETLVTRAASLSLILSLLVAASSAKNVITHEDLKEAILKMHDDQGKRIDFYMTRVVSGYNSVVRDLKGLERRVTTSASYEATVKSISKTLESIEAIVQKEDTSSTAVTMKHIMESQKRSHSIFEVLLSQMEDISRKLDLSTTGITEANARCTDQIMYMRDIRNSMNKGVDNSLKEGFESLMQKEKSLIDQLETYINQANSLNGNMQYSTEGRLSDISESISQLTNRVTETEQNTTNEAIIKLSGMINDVNRRTEYEVDRIISVVTLLVKEQGKSAAANLKEGFTETIHKIMSGQNATSQNVTEFVGKELSAVWRQMGSMFQMLEAAKPTIEQILSSTDKYFNGSMTALKNMDNTVRDINSQTETVGEDLNILQGQMSLIAQEFNHTKNDLFPLFDDLSNSLKQFRGKIPRINNPGPHPIGEEA